MDVLVLLIGALLLVIGLIGSILPLVPSVPLCWVSLWCIRYFDSSLIGYYEITLAFLIGIIVMGLDYYVPIWGIKKMGGSKTTMLAGTIGVVCGFIFPVLGPFTFLIFLVVFSFCSEYFIKKEGIKKGLKASLGSFLGFLMGSGLKMSYGLFIGYMYWNQIDYDFM